MQVSKLAIYSLLLNIAIVLSQNPPPHGPHSGGNTSTGGTVCDITTKVLKYEFNGSDESTYSGGYLKVTSNNCPGYDWTTQTTPNKALEINETLYFPLQPKLAKTPFYPGMLGSDGNSNSSPIKGPIGMAVNGIKIFSNVDAKNQDAYLSEGHTFDECGGHPNETGIYHYHEEPDKGCIYEDISGVHSPLFGIMYDGIPIFGSQGDGGSTPTDLDECGGHVDKTFPFYHYHLPANRVFPYTISCLKGCIFNINGNNNLSSSVKTLATCNLADKQYDYSNFYTLMKSNSEENDKLALESSGVFMRNSMIIYLLISILF